MSDVLLALRLPVCQTPSEEQYYTSKE